MSVPLLLRIHEWDNTFERASTRAVERCGYICNPNSSGGTGMAIVQAEPDGAAIYGIYAWLVQRCSRQIKPNPGKNPHLVGKFERSGWVTENGLPDGKRSTLELLAHAFRRPLTELVRMVQVVNRPEVGWIEVVDGSQSWTFNKGDEDEWSITIAAPSVDHRSTINGPSTDHRPTIDRPSMDHRPTIDAPMIDGQNGSTIVAIGGPSMNHRPTDGSSIATMDITDRQTDRQTEPLLSPKGDGEGKVGRQKEESEQPSMDHRPTINGPSTDHRPTIDEPSTDHRPTDDEPLQYSEAESWLNKLFGRKKAWSHKEVYELSQHLPLSREDQRLIDWGYALPQDSEGWVLYQGQRMTKPKQSMGSLLENFNDELDKFRGLRKQLGLNGLNASGGKLASVPEPEGWRDAAFEIYGESVRLPQFFREFPQSSQIEIVAALENKKSGVAA